MPDVVKLESEDGVEYNAESGLVLTKGSKLVKELAKFEQFHSEYTIGTVPGNPYRYQPFPKMLYKAHEFKGAARCLAAPPNPNEYTNPGEFQQNEELARQFDLKCQLTVQNEQEMTRAMETGWRESPKEAVDYLLEKQRAVSTAAAERLYSDQKLSEKAQREAAKADAESDGRHVPVIPEAPRQKRKYVRKVKPVQES